MSEWSPLVVCPIIPQCHSLTHSLTHSLKLGGQPHSHSLTHCHSLTHSSFVHSFVRSFVRSFVCSLSSKNKRTTNDDDDSAVVGWWWVGGGVGCFLWLTLRRGVVRGGRKHPPPARAISPDARCVGLLRVCLVGRSVKQTTHALARRARLLVVVCVNTEEGMMLIMACVSQRRTRLLPDNEKPCVASSVVQASRHC